MLKIYIAGPISRGMWDENIGKAIECYNRLLDMSGIAPYLPHLNFFCALSKRRETHIWLEQDKEWLACCDALLRLPGESRGAEIEIAEAHRLHIPVFYGEDELKRYLKGKGMN